MTSPDETTPGEVERVPLKVVPIFVTPIDDEPDAEPEVVEAAVVEPKPRPIYVAVAAIVLALATIGVHVAALVVASNGDFATGTTLGYVAIGLSIAAVLAAIGAVIVGRWRWWAVLAAVVAVLANPYVLLVLLRFLSGLQIS